MTTARILRAALPLLPLAAAALLAMHAAARHTTRHHARRLRTRAELFERTSKRPELIAGLRYAADVIDPPRHP